jgi:hypothetical protein
VIVRSAAQWNSTPDHRTTPLRTRPRTGAVPVGRSARARVWDSCKRRY